MSVEAISAVSAQLAAATPAAAAPATVAPPTEAGGLASMTDLLKSNATNPGDGLFDRLVSSLGEIDTGIASSSRAATELALGQTDNLHQVMIGAERTRLEFELAMSVRNRLLEAYQEIMRMQV